MMHKLTKLTTRTLALLFALFATGGAWATTALQPTVSGGTFTINDENSEDFDNCTQTVSSPTLTIPASTDLPEGTKVAISEISIGKRGDGTGTYPDKIRITVGTKTYTSASKTEAANVIFTCAATEETSVKQTYSFADAGCILSVGTTYTIAFLNSSGSAMTGDALNVRVAKNTKSLFGSTVQWGATWRPVQEIKGDIIYTCTVASDGSSTWDITPPSSTTLRYWYEVAESASFNAGSLTCKQAYFNVAEGKTLTLTGSDTITASSGIYINSGTVALPSGNSRMLNGSFKGNGTVEFTNVYGTVLDLSSKGVANSDWKGTLAFKNVTAKSGWQFSKLGNANSTVRFDGVTDGYFNNKETFDGTVDIGSGGLVLHYGNGSGTLTTLSKLTGSGEFKITGGSTYNGGCSVCIKNVDGFTGKFNLVSGANQQITIGDTGSCSQSAKIIIAAGKVVTPGTTWEANGGIVVNGTLIVTKGVSIPAMDASSTGTVEVRAGASLDVGMARPTIAGVGAGATLTVSPNPTANECILGYTPNATFTVTDAIDEGSTFNFNGKTVTPVVSEGTMTLTDSGTNVPGDPTYTGYGWWWDYEFNGNGNNSGSDGASLKWDDDRAYNNNEYTTADGSGNRMLHLPARPWRDVSAYPTEFTAVMFCKAGATANGILVSFGSTTHDSCKTITLTAGANPSAGQMRLVYADGTGSATDLVEGGFTLDNITSANHLYAFTVKTVNNKSQIAVYADGDLLTTYEADSIISLGTGFQIASAHGGLGTGTVLSRSISRLADNDAATMDFLRVSNVALSDAAIKALAAEYRYVSPNGIAERTLSENATWTDSTNTSWGQKTLNEDGSSTTTAQAAPNSGTVVEVTASTDVQLTMDLASEVSYEKLTFQGDGAITVKAGEAGTVAPTVTTRTYINTDVTMDIGAFASLGATTIAAGKTLTVVPNEQSTLSTAMGLGIRGTASSIVTGTVTLGAGSQVVLPDSMVSAFAAYGFTLALESDAAGRYVYTISRDDNPVYITKDASSGAITYAMYPKDCPPISLPGEPEIIPADFAYDVTIVNNHQSEPLTVATSFYGGNMKIAAGSRAINFTGSRVAFNIPSDDTLNLNGTVAVDEIVFTGGGIVVCSAANTLQGTVKGSATIKYPTGVLPVVESTGVAQGADFTHSAWTGTLVLTNCQFYTGNTRQRAPFERYGNANSFIKAPGFKGYAADTEQNTICQAELIIDEGTTFEFNHGWQGAPNNDTDIYSEAENANFKFRKLSGSGKLMLDGTTDYAQYIFCDVSDFTGDVEITFPGVGGRKSYLFGVPADYNTVGSAYPANLVIMGSVNVPANKTWTIPAGVIISENATLKLGAGSTVTALSPSSRGTLKVESGTANVTSVKDSVINAVLDIAENATLCVNDTTITKLTIPADATVTYKNSGTLDLSGCTALTTLYLELGSSKTFDFGKISLPDSCQTAYYYVGEARSITGTYSHTGTFSGTINYIATETSNEFASGDFTMTNVPAGAEVWVIRKTGATVQATAPDNEPSKRTYSQGKVFSGTACWHEWDFELTTGDTGIENKLNDTGKFSVEGSGTITLTTDRDVTSSDYSSWSLANGEPDKCAISSAVHPRATCGTFGASDGNWSAAVRCTMPNEAGKHVAVSFGDTDAGVLGLAYDKALDIVELFKWDGGTYTPLVNLQVESATSAMHIYVIAVKQVTENESTKKILSFYRDGEFIHKKEFTSLPAITQFKVGGVVVGTANGTGLPADASSGCVDYVRLYDKTLDKAIAEGLSARRPFVSAYPTYVREVAGNASWKSTAAWEKQSDGTTAEAPDTNSHVTLLANGWGAMSVNLDADAQYNTLIVAPAAGAPDNTWIEIGSNGVGKVGANTIVVRTKVTVDYGVVKFADAMVGVDEDASLTFNFSKYPYENVTTATKVYLTGKVIARQYDATVDGRILVVGKPSDTWTVSNPTYEPSTGRYYVNIELDHVPGSDVYYTGGYWSSTESSFAVTNASGKATTVFNGDTVVIPAYLSGDRANDAYIGLPLPDNVAKIRVAKDYKFMPGVADAILGGAKITVDSGATLSFADTSWNQLKLGAVTLNGAVSFIDDVEATSIAGNAAVTIDGKTLTLDAPSAGFTGSFSGTGTVKIKSVTGDGFDVTKYMPNNGTLAIVSMSNYFKSTANNTVNVSSALRLDGNVTISALSEHWTYTFAKITGTGDFTIPNASCQGFTIQNIQDYTGSLNTSRDVTINKITLNADVPVGTLLLATSGAGTVTVTKAYVGDAEQTWPVAYAAGGVYKASASYGGTGYRYIADAISAAGQNIADIRVYDMSVEMPIGYAISQGHVVKVASTFLWVGGNEDNSWTNLSNWRIGGDTPARLPDSVDTVSFSGTTVVMPGNVTVGAVNCDRSVTLTKVSSDVTLTASSVELTVLGASISVSGVTLSSTPTTTVTDATVSTATNAGVTTYTAVNEYAARIGDTKYETLEAAIDAAGEEDVITLLNDVTIDLSKTFSKAVTIDGNSWQYTITFNLKAPNSLVNTTDDALLVLQNVNLTMTHDAGFVKQGDNLLTVPNHNISFNCPVTLKSVVSDTALAFYKDATLDGVVVAEKSDAYAIWIHTSAANVSIEKLTVNTTAGRGIKVSDAFLSTIGASAAESTSLSIDGATFTTKNAKAAVLVGAGTPIAITATGTINISGVLADTTNLVWVDEDYSATFGTVSLDTTGATGISSVIGTEPISGGYAATLSTGGNVDGYYKTLSAAIVAAQEDQTITLLKNADSATISKAVTVAISGNTLTGVVLSTKDATLTVLDGTATVTTTVTGGAKVKGTTSAGVTTYKVVYGTIFSVY